MSQPTEVNIHLHIHEGTSEAAARAAAEALRGSGEEPGESLGAETSPQVEESVRREYVGRAYAESEGKAKPMLEFLADNPDRLIPYSEISAHLGFDTARSLPGLLGSFGKRANHRYEGVWPFEAIFQHDGWNMRMTAEDAEIINALR